MTYRGTYNTNSQSKFKTSMLRSSLCNHSDEYILLNRTITIIEARNDDAVRRLDERNKESKKVIFKNCVPFMDRVNEINNT